jgi:DNA-binding transcriptional ArsR family regulator
MDYASWIYADLIGLGAAIIFVLVLVVFVDDLRTRFLWTKTPGSWTKARLTLSSTGFRGGQRCKTTISASARTVRDWLAKLDAFHERFLVRTGKSAVSYEVGLRRWGESFLPRAAVGPIQLKSTQQRAVAALTADPTSELTRGQYEQLADVSRSQAAYDLAELVEAGILERVGKGRATRYRLAREGGTQRHWTNDRICAELEAFCADRTTWPSVAEFKAAGRGDLYVAASRYGGIAHWTEALGFARSGPNAPAPARPSPLGSKLKWAGAGALAALGLAAAAGAILVNVDRHETWRANRAAQRPESALSESVTDESLHAVPATVRNARRTPARRVRHEAPRARRERAHVSPAKASSAPAQTSATSGVAGVRSFSSSTPAQPSWPAPLPAPSGGGAPPPLKSP